MRGDAKGSHRALSSSSYEVRRGCQITGEDGAGVVLSHDGGTARGVQVVPGESRGGGNFRRDREALGIDVLRKIVNHPDLLERRTHAANDDYGEAVRSGKLQVTLKVLSLWREQGHRCLVFSQTQQMLDIIESAVASAGYNYRRMDGNTSIAARMSLIDDFNDEDSGVFAFLLTTKVGGLGVNLTGRIACCCTIPIGIRPRMRRRANVRGESGRRRK